MKNLATLTSEILLYFVLFLAALTKASFFSEETAVFFICLFIFSFFVLQFARNLVAKYVDNTYIGILLLSFFLLLFALGSAASNAYLHYKISVYLLIAVFFYFSMTHYFHNSDYKILYRSVVVASLAIFTASLWEIIAKYKGSLSDESIILYNPNIIAHLIIIFSPFLIIYGTYRITDNKKTAFISFASAFSLFLCLLFTFSRSGLITYFITVTMIYILYLIRRKRILHIFYVLIGTLLLILLLMPRGFMNKFSEEQILKSERLEQSLPYFSMLSENFFTGVGLGESGEFFKRYSSTPDYPEYTDISSYLIIAAEGGILALILYCVIAFIVYISAYNIYRDTSMPQEKEIILLGSIVAITGHFIHSLFGCFYRIPVITLIFIILLATISSLNSRLRIQSYFSNLFISVIVVTVFLFIFIDHISLRLLVKSDVAVAQHKYEIARQNIARAKNMLPFNPLTYKKEFFISVITGNIDPTPLYKTVELNPEDSESYFLLGISHYILRDTDSSVKFLRQARILNKSNALYELAYGLVTKNNDYVYRAVCLCPQLLDTFSQENRDKILFLIIEKTDSEFEKMAFSACIENDYKTAAHIFDIILKNHRQNWYLKKMYEYFLEKNIHTSSDCFDMPTSELFHKAFPVFFRKDAV